jgi:hypothetical protein
MSRPEDATPPQDGFLARWARRKQEVQRQASEPPNVVPAPEPAVEEGEPPPLPSLDSIIPGSDISAFFQKHVPEALRTAALRKLWVTDPEIRNFIEMADYQWDFNNPDSIPGWSSSVKGVDVKAMVDHVFGTGPVREAVAAPENAPAPGIAAKPDDAVQSVEKPEPSGISENAEIARENDPAGDRPSISGPDLIQFGAMQQSTDESSVYDIVRKRHGGALPT